MEREATRPGGRGGGRPQEFREQRGRLPGRSGATGTGQEEVTDLGTLAGFAGISTDF